MPEKYIPGGYILLSRRLIESEIWDKPPMYLKVWIYILSKARHEAEGPFERGELLLSIPELQEACSYKVGFRKETPSKKQIFNILEFLRNPYDGHDEGNDEGDDKNTAKETMIETQKTTRGLIVKVHNYSVYQNPKNYKKQREGNAEGNTKEPMKETTKATVTGTTGEHYTQELKELKNVNKDIYSSENQESSSSPHVNNFEVTNTQDLLQKHEIPDNKLGNKDRMDLYRLHKQVGDKYLIQFINRAKSKNKPTANYVLGILRNETKNGELTFDDFEKNIPKQKKQGNDPTRKLKELTEEDVMGGM